MTRIHACYVFAVSWKDYRVHVEELVEQCTAIEWKYAEEPK